MPRLSAALARRYGPRADALTRRELLRATLATGAALLLSGEGAARAAHRRGARVVVVGAGFGGLACAHELHALGYDVRVLDARDRVGGRVLSFRDVVPGAIVEGGGELIGRNHPTWLAYARRFGLHFWDVSEAPEGLDAPVVLGGHVLSAAAAEALWKEMDAAQRLLDADAVRVPEDEPWRTRDARRLDRKTIAQWIAELHVSARCKHGLATQFAADNGVDCERQSYLGMLAQVKGGGLERYWTESESLRCREGNQTLAERLAAVLGPQRVALGTPVTAIADAGDRAMTVTLADGRRLECDDVVLAVPPSLWGTITCRLARPLPATPQMGCAVKYLAHVRERFWLGAGRAPDGFGDGDISFTWEATDGQAGDGACLTAFSGGPAAQRCRSVPRERRDGAYAAGYERMFPGFAPQVVGTRFMDWPGDPWTRAGYSFPAPGEVTTVGPVLRDGIGRLHFAGEHACYKFVGYMEGALSAGAALARRLAERDGLVRKAS